MRLILRCILNEIVVVFNTHDGKITFKLSIEFGELYFFLRKLRLIIQNLKKSRACPGIKFFV